MAPLTDLCVLPYLDVVSSFLCGHDILQLSSCTRALRQELLPFLRPYPPPKTPGVLALERHEGSHQASMMALQVDQRSLGHLAPALRRIGRMRSLRKLIVGDFVGFRFIDLETGNDPPPLNWTWLQLLIETMRTAEWENLQDFFLACHFGEKMFSVKVWPHLLVHDEVEEEEGAEGTDQEDDDGNDGEECEEGTAEDDEEEGEEEEGTAHHDEKEEEGEEGTDEHHDDEDEVEGYASDGEEEEEEEEEGPVNVVVGLPVEGVPAVDLSHLVTAMSVVSELRVPEVPPSLLTELIASLPTTLTSLNIGGLACCFPEAAFDAVLSGLATARLHSLTNLTVPGMFKGGEATLAKLAALLASGSLPSVESMRFAITYDGPDDMTTLLDALPHCPNLRVIKFGRRRAGGVPMSNLHHMLQLLRDGRLPHYQQPPLCNLPLVYSEEEMREAWEAVADVFRSGGLAEARSIDMCFGKPALDGPTFTTVLFSLPQRFETLEVIRLRTTTSEAQHLQLLPKLLTTENLPALRDVELHCEGPIVSDDVLGEIFESALDMSSIESLELTWKHLGQGPRNHATLAKAASDVFRGRALPGGDDHGPHLPLDAHKVVALIVASAPAAQLHVGCLYLLRMDKDDRRLTSEEEEGVDSSCFYDFFPYDGFFDRTDIPMPVVIQDSRWFSIPANSGMRDVPSKGGFYSRSGSVSRSSAARENHDEDAEEDGEEEELEVEEDDVEDGEEEEEDGDWQEVVVEEEEDDDDELEVEADDVEVDEE